MKSTVSKTFCTFILLSFISFGSKAQTNVSGGIFTNTTWTQANSPYIVTDTVVVFPGVTLTIQPGVTVKFANAKRIELRQAKINAKGMPANAITFTSNAALPAPGIYEGIYINGGNLTSVFDYCNFSYANSAINSANTNSDSLTVSNSFFSDNSTGIKFYPNATWSQNGTLNLTSSVFKNNINYGLDVYYLNVLKIDSCHFTNNNTGFNCGGLNNSSANFLKNSLFSQNITAVNGIIYTLVDNCTITHNQTGISSGSVNRIKNSVIDSNSTIGVIAILDSVLNCRLWHNGKGIQGSAGSVIMGNNIQYSTTANIIGGTRIIGNIIRNASTGIDNTTSIISSLITGNLIQNNNIGININHSGTSITCNVICNNTTYDLKYGASGNLSAGNNYWCTPDSAATETVIYDAHDNISFGIVSFMPIDTAGCQAIATGILNPSLPGNFSFRIFPNPATESLTIELPVNISKAEIKIVNLLGELEYFSKTTSQKTNIVVSALANGLHIVQITSGNTVSRQRFIKQ